MKPLELNPQNFEIKLDVNGIEEEGCCAEVQLEFGETKGLHCFSKMEAKKVGNWFLKLGEQLK